VRDWAHRQVDPYRAAIIRFRERVVSLMSSTRSPSVLRRLQILRVNARTRGLRYPA
jgi:hypothetical protein